MAGRAFLTSSNTFWKWSGRLKKSINTATSVLAGCFIMSHFIFSDKDNKNIWEACNNLNIFATFAHKLHKSHEQYIQNQEGREDTEPHGVGGFHTAQRSVLLQIRQPLPQGAPRELLATLRQDLSCVGLRRMVADFHVEWQTLLRDSPPSPLRPYPLPLLSHQPGADGHGRHQLCDDFHGSAAHRSSLLLLHLYLPRVQAGDGDGTKGLSVALVDALFLRYGDGVDAGTRPLLLVALPALHDTLPGGYGDEREKEMAALARRHPQFPDGRCDPQQYRQDLPGGLVRERQDGILAQEHGGDDLASHPALRHCLRHLQGHP